MTAASRRDVGFLLTAFLLLVAWDAAGWDLAISRSLAGAAGFAWRDRWLTAGLLHDDARRLAWAVGAVLLVNIWRSLPFARGTTREERVAWLVATAACALLVPALKYFSRTSCPWSLAEFGGTARHVSHWAFGQADGGPGRCFPAGHAAAAFCFLPGWLALRRSAPAAARRWLLGVLAAGAVLAATQVIRGAHFVSHTLWSGWCCWALGLAVYEALRKRLARRGALSATCPLTALRKKR